MIRFSIGKEGARVEHFSGSYVTCAFKAPRNNLQRDAAGEVLKSSPIWPSTLLINNYAQSSGSQESLQLYVYQSYLWVDGKLTS